MKRILQQSQWQGYLCLAIGMVLLILSGPQWNSSLATWIYPILLLRFLALFKSRWSLPLLFIIFLCSLQIAYLNVIPVPGLSGLMILIVIALNAFLPYLLYTLLKWTDDFFSTLLFPIALVAAEYAFSFGPYGTWGSIANTQYYNKILLQLASITGQWGISFVIGWTAAVVNWIWSQPIGKASLLKTKAYFICIALIFVFGLIRWQIPHSSESMVKVAGVAVKLDWGQFHLNELSRKTTDPKLESQRIFLLRSADQVLTIASREAKKGANIVLGAEGNILLHQRDEPAFLQKAMAVG
jgi:apolipoprotein N-acyltransferase